MLTLEITTHYVSAPKLLSLLQSYWLKGRVKEHAETSAIALTHLASNPGYLSSRFLPLVLDFTERNGAHGVEGFLFSALSAAAANNQQAFRRSIDRLSLITSGLKVRKNQPEFGIPFIDFDSIPATRVPIRSRGDAGSKYGKGVSGRFMSDIVAGLTGEKSVEALHQRFGFGAEIIQHLLNSSHTDAARKLVEDLAGLTAQSEFGLLPGFGLNVRKSANGLDKAEGSGAEKAATGWSKIYKETATLARHANQAKGYSSGFEKVATVASGLGGPLTANPSTTVPGIVVLGVAGAAGLVAVGLKAEAKRFANIIKQLEDAVKSAEKASKGTTKKTDKDRTTKMPLPDDVGDGTTRFEDFLAAASAYASRLNPHINPTGEDFGGSVIYAKIPVEGDIDPSWEHVSINISEEDLIALLGFIQRKYFDSLINPVKD